MKKISFQSFSHTEENIVIQKDLLTPPTESPLCLQKMSFGLFKTKTVVLTDKRGCYIMIKGTIRKESVTFVNTITVENFNTPLTSVGTSLRPENT